MATRHLFGSAAIRYTPPGESEVTHLLGAKLVNLEPAHMKARWDWWAVGGKDRETVTVGDGVDELLATIRYDDDPSGLRAMLRHGLESNVTLTYEETLGGTEYPVKLVAVAGMSDDGKIPLRPDRDRWRLGEYEVRIHVRRVDGGSLEGLL